MLTASLLGLPVSITHVSTGSLMEVRFADRQADALKAILIAWLVTLPAAALIGALVCQALSSWL